MEELDTQLEGQHTLEVQGTHLEVQVTLDTQPEVQHTLEELDTLQEEQDIQQEDMVTPQGTLLEEVTLPEVMDTPLEAMDTQQGTLQEVLTLLGATDTPLEVMDIHQEDTLQEGQQVTLLEAMDTHLEDMDTPREAMDTLLEVMDTLQVAILQEGIQDLLEVDTTADTTERNKTHLMVRGLLSDINSTRNIGFMLLSSLWK